MDPIEEKLKEQHEAARQLGAEISALRRRLGPDASDEVHAVMLEAEQAIHETMRCLRLAGVKNTDAPAIAALIRDLVHAAVEAGYERHCSSRPSRPPHD